MSQADSPLLALSQNEKEFLFALVRSSIKQGLDSGRAPKVQDLPVPAPGVLHEAMGAFVTLHSHGDLRGCIGMIQSPEPLYQTVAAMAFAAAFQDQRFPPLRKEELPSVTFDISILGPIGPCPDINLIELGRHGIILEVHGRRALFLPQVAVEQGWDLPTTLAHLSLKAGLDQNAWKDPSARVYWYESVLIMP